MSGFVCPNEAQHTLGPDGYVAWSEWARKKRETHDQVRCDGCGLSHIWVPKAEFPDEVLVRRDDLQRLLEAAMAGWSWMGVGEMGHDDTVERETSERIARALDFRADVESHRPHGQNGDSA